MNVIIIEDQAPAQRILKTFITNYGSLNLNAIFNDPIEALTYLKTNSDIDIIFLDVHLPKISGLEFLNLLDSYKYVILTTAFDNYAVSGFNYNVVDYLLKPYSYNRFNQAMTKVAQLEANHSNSKADIITIKIDGFLTKIELSKVMYIKSDGDYTFIYFRASRKMVSQPLKFWEKELKHHQFSRIHKSYIVNLDALEKVSSTLVHINHIELPIGRVYKQNFMNDFNKKT